MNLTSSNAARADYRLVWGGTLVLLRLGEKAAKLPRIPQSRFVIGWERKASRRW